MKNFLVFCLLSTAVFAEDVMVERMQSVVDEVVDLRARYEASEQKLGECVNELQSQEQMINKLSRGEGLDFKEYEKNRNEIEKLKRENKTLKNYQKEIESLEKENSRLSTSARILVDKNQELLSQVNRYKKTSSGEVQALEIELKTTLELLAVKQVQNRSLDKELRKTKAVKQEKILVQAKPCPVCKTCEKSVTKIVKVCEDENPFPELMQKDGKTVKAHPVELEHILQEIKVPKPKKKIDKQIISEKASSYRMKNESVVYESINGKVVAVWENKTSFTSNITQGSWIKITGYFVNKKWKRATKTLWVKSKDTIKR